MAKLHWFGLSPTDMVFRFKGNASLSKSEGSFRKSKGDSFHGDTRFVYAEVLITISQMTSPIFYAVIGGSWKSRNEWQRFWFNAFLLAYSNNVVLLTCTVPLMLSANYYNSNSESRQSK